MDSNIKYLVLILLILLICSCKKYSEKEISFILLLDPNSSIIVEKKFPRDSIVIKSFYEDSILISKYSNGKPIESIYFYINNELCEKRTKGNEFGEILGIDSILTFSKKDTTFTYKSVRKFIASVVDYSFADCEYDIRKIENEYITTKQSLIDTTYKEIFFYDKDYHIYKFINTWKDNTCVYVKKD